MAIYLIRHGETVDNATRVVQLPDAALSAAGRLQAEALARRLADAGIVRIVASDLHRARATATTIAAATGAPVEIDPDLAERNYGDIRGTPYAELGVDIFAPDYAPPGGETWDAFHARVDRVWQRLVGTVTHDARHVAVVTHGLVCRAIALRHLVLPAGTEAPLHWGNTALTIVDGAPPRTVRILGCTAHLTRRPDGADV